MPIILHKWDILINSTLTPNSAFVKTISNEGIEKFIAESELERNNVRTVLIEGIIESQKIIDKQQYIQVVQAMLIRMLDKLHSYKKENGLDNKQCRLYNSITHHLEEVLNFLEDFFGNYFDRNEKVPAPYLLISLEQLRNQLQQLKNILELNSTIDPELTNVLISNFTAFCSTKSVAPTYNELLYQNDLMNELLSNNLLYSESSIKELLIYFNFNNHDYVTYLFGKLKALTESFDSNKEIISALRYEQKSIKQSITKLHCFLSPNMPSLKEQVYSWIEEEIKYLETEPSFLLPIKTETETEEKIQTSLSVSKLAVLVRLMIIDKIIANRVVAQVLRIVIRNFATAQTEHIGFSSFESKYHKPDRGTIAAVKDMLFRWINILSKL